MKKKHLKRLVRQQAYRIVALTAELDVLRRTPPGVVTTWPIDDTGKPIGANCRRPLAENWGDGGLASDGDGDDLLQQVGLGGGIFDGGF